MRLHQLSCVFLAALPLIARDSADRSRHDRNDRVRVLRSRLRSSSTVLLASRLDRPTDRGYPDRQFAGWNAGRRAVVRRRNQSDFARRRRVERTAQISGTGSGSPRSMASMQAATRSRTGSCACESAFGMVGTRERRDTTWRLVILGNPSEAPIHCLHQFDGCRCGVSFGQILGGTIGRSGALRPPHER